MALDAQRSIHGITAIGSYTGSKGGPYIKTSWGLTQPAGATIRASTTIVEQFSGQSVFVQDSFMDGVAAQVEFGLISGTLETLRRMMGLPSAALTGDLGAGTPTMETLTIGGTNLGSQEQSLYLTTPGSAGPRNYHFPRTKVVSFPELVAARNGYLEPRTTFALYPNTSLELAWIEDAP